MEKCTNDALAITEPSVTNRFASRKRADAHVTDRERALVIALYADVARRQAAVLRPGGELARLEAGLPIRTSRLVLADPLAVQPVLHVGRARPDARAVPLLGRLHDARRRGIERVVGAGRRQPALAVRMA